jgi:Family of unknown function (DUF6345)
MIKQRSIRTIQGASLCLLTLFSGPSHALSVYIDHPSSYPTGDCHAADNDGCGDVTGPLRTTLASSGWTVHYWTADTAWATDFIDCTIMSGQDCTNADASDMAIYDGHGNTGMLTFAYSHNGICLGLPSQTELGRLSGATTALFISTACCYMNLALPGNFTDHGGLNQQLGFGGEASMTSDMIGNFYSQSSGSNAGAWLAQMEDKPGLFTGDNTTVAFTRGATSADANNNYYNCGLRHATCRTRLGLTVGSAWRYDYRDHGTAGCIAP